MSAIIIDLAFHKERMENMANRRLNRDREGVPNLRVAEGRAIRKAIDRNKTFERAEHAQTVAARLTEMLDEAKRHGFSRTAIAAKAWLGKEKVEKRLYKVSLPRASKPAPDARRRWLDKKPRNYALVAEAIADLRGLSPEGLLLELFRGTSVEREMESERDRLPNRSDPGEAWEELTNLIEQMAAAVSRQTGLREHLRKISNIKGSYDLATDGIRRTTTGFILPHGPLAHNFEVYEEFPPVPSVILYEELIRPRFERMLSFGAGRNSASSLPDLSVEVSVWREVRLAIGPADQVEIPRPLFEVRTRVDLISAGKPIAVRRPWFCLEGREKREVVTDNGDVVLAEIYLGPPEDFDGEIWAPLEGWDSRRVLPEHIDREVEIPFEGLGEEGGLLQPEHYYAVWYPVTADTCVKLLSRPATSFPSDGLRELWLHLAETDVDTLVPDGTVGAALEAALLGEERTIEKKLAERASQLVALVENYAAEKHQCAREQHENALARWRSSQ